MPRTRIKQSVDTTESGIHVIKNEMEIQEPYFVKEVSEEQYEVRNGEGEIFRTYIKQPGCDDPKEAAESFAKKMSIRWQQK